ncbi:MAG TPA: archease [Fimbriiglobus sp.]|jgi:SHS2 domain-containing protein
MYELFDHTADLGIRASAPTLNELFADAAAGLFSCIVEYPEKIEPKIEERIEIVGDDKPFLLFDWLRELLRKSETDGMVYTKFEVDVRDAGLAGTAWGEPLDPENHGLGREVKAITYHGLTVETTSDGWLAEVIVDI